MPGKIVPVTSASNIALKRNLRGEGRGWGFTFKKKLKRNIVGFRAAPPLLKQE